MSRPFGWLALAVGLTALIAAPVLVSPRGPALAAPLGQATATPVPTATPTATPTPTPTPTAAPNFYRYDQPDGVRCYVYYSGAQMAMSCLVVP